MKYVIEISGDVERALEQRASATGDNVVHLIQMAVVSLVRSDARSPLEVRRPDQQLEAVESVVPSDLPRSAPRPIAVQRQTRRQPDPIVDSA